MRSVSGGWRKATESKIQHNTLRRAVHEDVRLRNAHRLKPEVDEVNILQEFESLILCGYASHRWFEFLQSRSFRCRSYE